jgi:hypothetical protein
MAPWQFDKDVTYNGRKNTYSFMLNGKKVNLLPLSSQQEFLDNQDATELLLGLGKDSKA